MSIYNANDYSFEALCLKNIGGKINTLAYLVGLVDSASHKAGNPEIARYDILYPLSEGEAQAASSKDLLGIQAEFLPQNYLPQTPVMFVQRWSPILAMLKSGFEPESLNWLGGAPHAVATGIWKPSICVRSKNISECRSDEDLFWSIMAEAFKRAMERDYFVSIIAQVGWNYEDMVGSLQSWNDKIIAQTGRILWKRTWQG